MAQIHISKGPSGQRAVTFAYDPYESSFYTDLKEPLGLWGKTETLE